MPKGFRSEEPYSYSDQRAYRRCLGGCERLFLSSGPEHRRCPGCEGRLERMRLPPVILNMYQTPKIPKPYRE